jgi:hypothetical protein
MVSGLDFYSPDESGQTTLFYFVVELIQSNEERALEYLAFAMLSLSTRRGLTETPTIPLWWYWGT